MAEELLGMPGSDVQRDFQIFPPGNKTKFDVSDVS
jgi:hypothetical protein